MKYKFIFFITLFSVNTTYAQRLVVHKIDLKLDSLVKLSQHYINNNQPDSLYMIMSSNFKEKVSIDKLKEVTGLITDQMGKWIRSEPKDFINGTAHYKAIFTETPLDFYISKDNKGNIDTFLFKPIRK